MKKDKVLLAEDTLRKENSQIAMEILEEGGVAEWQGFGDESIKVLGVRGGSGQVHVGDVFRAVFPTLEYLRSRGMKVVLASSPGLEKIFSSWQDTIKIVDASQPPEEIARIFSDCHVSHMTKWGNLHRRWKGLLKKPFDHAARPVVKSSALNIPHDLTLELRRNYSEGETKKVLGIVWRTSMIGRNPDRNASLKEFTPLIQHKHGKWNVISLQYGDMSVAQHEVEGFNRKEGENIIFDPQINPMRDYVAASCQMAACDHIVSIDCSQVFQAGATGVPVSVLLSEEPAKQWSEFIEGGSEVCPFFPDTARIYLQKKSGDWEGPVKKARERMIHDGHLLGTWSHPAAQNIKRSMAR